MMDGNSPFIADLFNSVPHTEHGAHGCTVTVRVKAGLNSQADRLSEISGAVKQRRGYNHGVGKSVAPVVRGMFVIYPVDMVKADLFRNARVEALQHGVNSPVEPGGAGNLRNSCAENIFEVCAA